MQESFKGFRHLREKHSCRTRIAAQPVLDVFDEATPIYGAQEKRSATLFQPWPVANAVGGLDAGPGLGQRSLGVAYIGLDGNQVAARVAIQDLLTEK